MVQNATVAQIEAQISEIAARCPDGFQCETVFNGRRVYLRLFRFDTILSASLEADEWTCHGTIKDVAEWIESQTKPRAKRRL